jgi:amino acid adenylation domain-containing protein
MMNSNSAPKAPGLSAETLELLAHLLEEEGIELLPAQRITPRGHLDELPLSFAQQRLWFLSQLDPASPVYNLSSAYRLRGPLNTTVLERSLNEIVRRHESLRTMFPVVDGRPVQVVTPHQAFALPVIDLRALGRREKEARAMRLTSEHAQRPFDLAQGPLFRAALVQLTAEESVLLVSMHHIVSDGWSMGVFFRELAALYAAFSSGKASPLPELPVQYTDFAVWQRQWLQGEVLEQQLAYWKQQLAGSPPRLELPADRPRPLTQTYRGARQALVLPPPLSDALRALSQREGVTLFMTLLAAFQTLLSRYTGQPDILVGSPIAGRNRVATEGLIGFFVNTLVLRTDLSGEPTFRQLLHRVREVASEAYMHQDLPFERLVEELQPERILSHSALFQVFFNMLNLGDHRLELPGCVAERFPTPAVESKFDLTLYVRDQHGGLHFSLVYNTDLFGQERMAEMLAQWRQLLAQIVAQPDERIDRYSLVTPAAAARLPNPAQRLRATWEGAVQARFSAQARRVPDQMAVVDTCHAWTYAELEARSNQLANYLGAHGLQPQEVVAIYAHRSSALVWALLGVLKAGGAFLILDPGYPTSRLIECLRAAKPRAWIQLEAAGSLPEALAECAATSACRCRVELPRRPTATAGGRFADYSTDDPEVTVGPDDLAYLAFTSGSTGQPKGILGGHRPISHFLSWYCRTLELSAADRFSMLSGLSHDPLLRDIFTPLWLGATLYIPELEDLLSPGHLAAWAGQRALSLMHLTPALGHLLTDTAAGASLPRSHAPVLPSLRYACFGGDVLTLHEVSRLRALAPGVTCVNFYGTTETPQAVGFFIIPPADVVEPPYGPTSPGFNGIVPVGRGIQDVQLLVLNGARQVVGIGEVGEIYVRTPYLSQGYLADAVLTQARFLVNPFTHVADDRLYRTGDLARYLPDGNVAFLGRRDDQVKLRGFRLELGEVEAVLRQHPAVREAVVMVREDVPGDTRLVVYLVLHPGQASTTQELRPFVQQRLPDYMVPTAFVPVDALPLTPNGKVDRHALPIPDPSALLRERPSFPPRTPVEAILAGIWAEVLGLPQVGVENNFFELGGHSLKATQVISRVRQALAVELPLRRFFETPTVAGLALAIEDSQGLKDDHAHLASILEGVEQLSDDEVKKQLTASRREQGVLCPTPQKGTLNLSGFLGGRKGQNM